MISPDEIGKRRVKVKKESLFSVFLAFMCATIIYIPNQLHFPTTLGLPGVNVINVLVLIVYLIHRSVNKLPSEEAPYKGRFYFYFFTLISSFIVSQIRMPIDLMEDITNLKTLLFYPILYFLFFYAVRKENDLKILYLMVLFVAFMAAVEAIREAIDYGIGNYNESHRASGPFGENFYSANRAGVFYAMFLPFFLSIAFFYKGNKLFKYAGIGGVMTLVAAIFFTYSRQSYFIAVIAIVYMIFSRRGWISFVAIFVIAMGPLWVPESAVQRIEGTEHVSDSGEEQLDESTASRFILWKGGMEMVAEYPQGIGLNRFKHEIGNFTIYSNKDAHNYYVLTVAQNNIIGLSALLLMMFTMWRIGRHVCNLNKDPITQMVGHGYTCSVICMCLGNFYGSPFANGEVMGDYWIMTGLTVRYLYIERTKMRRRKMGLDQSDSSGSEPAKPAPHPVFG